MQYIGFGRIENLTIHRGEPLFDPAPRVVQEIKMGAGENGPRPELAYDDFILKSQVTELFNHLTQMGDGPVGIEVKHGLPFRPVIEKRA